MIAVHVGRWSQAQREQMELCDRIDRVSERLPLHEPEGAGILAGDMASTLQRVHHFEEAELFPALETLSPQVRPLLVTFRDHHARDRSFAQAIGQALLGIAAMDARDLKALKAELAAFADSLRRHVQFEEAITMALFASRKMDERRVVQ